MAILTETAARRRSLPAACMIAFVSVKLVFLVVFAWNARYVMDEYHQAGLASYIPLGFYDGFMHAKTVLYVYFYNIAHSIGDDAVAVMRLCRAQTLLLVFAALVMIYLIARRMGRSASEALFAVCVCLAFSNFIERSFRVRSDSVATFFAIAALLTVVGEQRLRWRVFLSGILCGAAFLTTQKSIYFDVAMGVALVGDGLARRSVREAFRAGALLTAGWASAVLVYSFYFGGTGFLLVIREIFLGPATLALEGGTYYDNLEQFIWRTLLLNAAAYLICVFFWARHIGRFGELSRAERIAWIFTGVITALIFNHNQPWPYVFIMAIPFLSLWSAELPGLFARAGGIRSSVFMFVALLALAPSFLRNIDYLAIDNRQQNQTVRVAESLLRPGDSYEDGIGMIVTRPLAGKVWWDKFQIERTLTAAERGMSPMDQILADDPKLWILSYRTRALASVLEPIFEQSYVKVFPYILLSGVRVEPNETAIFRNRWPGDYRVYDLTGRPIETETIVDGETVAGGFRLEKGGHALRLPDLEDPVLILPADFRGRTAIPVGHEPTDLFEAVYG